MKVGIIGCGYWGSNLLRDFNHNAHVDLRYACDQDPERIKWIALQYPRLKVTTDYKALLRDGDVVAVAVATPVSTHCHLVKESLEAGKHVFVEKPLARSVREAERLVTLASKKGLTLLVDHTLIYTGAVRKIRTIVAEGELGSIHYFDSVRINSGLLRHDVNVIWDLATHDLSIIDFVFGEEPVSVMASAASHTRLGVEDVAYVTIAFKDNLIAHIHVNWLSPVKIRKIIIGGSKKMAVFDDLDPFAKLKVYDRGIAVPFPCKKQTNHESCRLRNGDMYTPAIDNAEALKTAVGHFVDCIINQKTPVTDGEAGLRVVRILEATDKSIRRGGARIRL